MTQLLLPETFNLLAGKTYSVEWRIRIRSKRIILRLHPQKRAALLVTLPSSCHIAKARELIVKSQSWIEQQLRQAESQKIEFKPEFVIPFCDKTRQLVHVSEKNFGILMDEHTIRCGGHIEFFSRRIQDFLKQKALYYFRSLSEEFTPLLSTKPSGLHITDAQSRWGSCSSQKVIRLSWRLIMAPHIVQHYVLAHELAHLEHMDHSSTFWQYVEQLTPYRKPASLWLKKYGQALLMAGKK